ncbi:hypothetical protein B484DRAFT_331786 [Ochromonadaceae sp. CCMP2298]|nr:hypothetical protein B484DRAFT_331786 [Ochromonadaceae sp. CCMP2298]
MAPLPRVPRQRGVLRAAKPHPSRGGSTGYSTEFRQDELSRYLAGGQISVCQSTIASWLRRFHPLVQTGNKADHAISGEYEGLLVFHRLVFPRGSANEVIAFIVQKSVQTKIFSRQQIYEADKRLGLTRKRTSVTAYQALTPHNLARRRLYWTAPAPVRIAGVPVASLIDMDEYAIHLSCVNRAHGKSVVGVCMRDAGHYQRTDKWTLMLAIDAQGFTHIVPRPAYRPQDAPVEYIFNQLEGKLQTRMNEIHNDNDLVRAVHNSIAELSTGAEFGNTFRHCGYV